MRPILFVSVVAFSIPIAAPGQARPRDDVMSSAFHCAVISDSRQWLDCYYGAAQPIRAQLNLRPAPTTQVNLAQSPPRGNETADVPIRTEVMASASNCYSIGDDRRWLDCYYGATQPMRTRLGLSPMPQAKVSQQGPVSTSTSNFPISPTTPVESHGLLSNKLNSAAPAESTVQEFGLVSSRPSIAHKIDHIVSRMVSYSFDRYGIFTVTLTDGQTWKQVSGDTDYAHWKKPATSYAVNISRGFMTSYNLQVQGIPGIYKVERIN
jgi:hypothetical protein